MAVLTVALAVACAPANAAQPQRIEIPIERVVMPDGIIRYSVPVTINGIGPVPALLDTGSTGLLVLSKAVSAKRFTRVGTFYSIFESGEKLGGVISRARISIGGLETGGPINMGIVQTASCISEKPLCSAGKLKPQDFAIAGDGVAGAGFQAILGIGLDRLLIANPLVGSGATTWIVSLPEPGIAGNGVLIVNPAKSELESYKRYPIPRESLKLMGAFRASLPGCLTAPDAGFNMCGRVGLDTGAPRVFARVAELPMIASSRTPQHFSLSLSEGEGKLDIPINENWQTKRLVFFEQSAKLAFPAINAGVAPYLSYFVFYDFQNNQIGLKPR